MRVLITVSFVLFVSISQLFSQGIQSTIEGFKIQAFTSMDSWSSDSFFLGDISDDDSSGLGFGVEVGYGVTPAVEVYLSYAQTGYSNAENWDIYRSSGLELGGKYHFGASLQKLRPFAQLFLNSNSMKLEPIFIMEGEEVIYDDAEMKLSGLLFGAGAGANYFITPEFSVGLNVSGMLGGYSTVKVNGNDYDPGDSIDLKFLRIRLAVSYLFY